MYLYFDINGNLKEIVQVPVREGSIKHNIIYIYVEKSGEPVDNVYHLSTLYTNGKINFKLVDSDVSLNVNLLPMTKVSDVQLPQNNQRDLYFFKYGYKYEMWSIELPASVTSVNGVVSASAYLYNESTQFALDTFSFNVQASVGMTMDSTITESQYTYLYNQLIKGYAVTGSQMTFTIIRNTLTNLNGRELTSFESELVTVGESYQAYKITRSNEKLTEDEASRYMEYMTGSSFLPKYNYESPKNSLFMLTDGTFLKPQYDNMNGLLLFVMTSPYLTKAKAASDYVPYTGAIKDVDLGGYKLSASEISAEGIKSTRSILPIPPSTTPTLIHAIWTGDRIRFVKNDNEEYLGTLSFPLSETNDTDVIASEKHVAENYPVTIDIAADLETPYKYNFSLLNVYDETLSTESITLASEEVTADLEAYVDNAVGTLETELDGRLDTLEAKHVYEHNITVSGSSASYETEVRFVIISNSATEINTQALLATALFGNPRGCVGYYIDKTYNHTWTAFKIYRDDATRVGITILDIDNQSTSNIVIGSASVSDKTTTVY